jgi:hypothetical protein
MLRVAARDSSMAAAAVPARAFSLQDMKKNSLFCLLSATKEGLPVIPPYHCSFYYLFI